MERPEVIDPLKEEQPILQQTPVEEPEPIDTQTEDAFSVRGLAEKRLGKVGATALDFVPILGDVLAAEDVAKSYKEGDAIGTAVNSLALAAGLIPIVGDVAAKGLKAGLKASRKPKKGEASKSYIEENAPKFIDEVSEAQTASKIERIDVSPDSNVVKSYKLFKTNKDGDLFPLFVKMEDNEPLPVGEWIKAQAGEINPKTGKVKSSIGDLAYRPGFHAGDLPIAPHIGGKMNLDTGRRLTGKTVKPNIREENQVWAEVEMLDDVDWQSVANSRASIVKSGPNKGKLNVKEAHITDQLPTGGHYRYKTNANMVGNWLIGGELKINRVLTSAEIKAINDKAGVADLPKLSDLGKIDLLTRPKAPTPKAPTAPILNFKKTSTDASNTFGEGVKRVTYTDPESGGNIAIIDRSAQNKTSSIVELFVPEKSRRKGIGKAIVKKAMEDYPNIMGQVSSKTAAKNAYDLGRRPVTKPDATLEEVFKMIEENSSVNLASKQAIKNMQLNKGGAIRTYKEGGVVPMQEQMNFAFMNEGGVLADDGVERDPVSGNEVPAGSMAEEVRDDVPAMLSEGEYVVPADVVRFHGIDKFEELRDEAKMGLSRMEADGRIGGQPVEEQEEFPFPVEELEGFAEGGAVGDTYSSVTGSDFRANQPYGAGGGRFPGVGFELRNFTNPKTGKTVVIPFFNGRPMQYLPPDFLEGGAPTTGGGGSFDPEADERSRQEDEAERARQGGLTPLAQDVVNKIIAGEPTRQQGKSFDKYTSEDWNNYIRNAESKTADVTSKIPIIGNLQRMSEKAARSFAMTALRSGKNPATEQPLSQEEKLTLEKVLTVAPNTSMTEALINAVTGKGETIQGLPLTEQAGFEFGKAVRQGDVMVKPVTKLPDDLLPDLSSFKEAEPTGPFYKAGETDAAVTEQDLPPAEYFGPSGEFQNIIDPQKTVAEQAQEIIEYAWVVVPGVNLNKKFRVDKRDLHLVGASPNDSARAILATDKHGIFDPVLRKTTGKGNLIQVHSEGPEGAKVLSRQNLARYSGANVNANASDVQDIIETNDSKVDKNKRSFIDSLKNAFDMSAGAATPTRDSVLTSTSGDRLTVGGVPIYNNPGNIEEGQGYAGSIGAYKTDRREDGRKAFVEFDSPQMGIRALTIDLKTKANRYNGDVEQMFLDYLGGGREGTIEQRYQRAAKDNDNIQTVKNYINNVKNKLGSDTLDVNNVDALTTTIKTVIENENKQPVIDYYNTGNVIREGVVLAGKSFDKSVKLADARKAMSGDLFQAGLVRQPPAMPVGLGGQAVAQPQDVSQFYGQRFDPSKIGTAPIDTDDMLKQAAQNIPAGSDIGPSFQNIIQPQQQPSGFQNIIEPQVTTPEYFGPSGFQNIIQPQVTTPKLDADVPQSNLPFVQGPPVAPTVGLPPTSPATAQDMQTQEAFELPKLDLAGTTTAPTIGGVSGISPSQPVVQEAPTQQRRLGLSPGAMGGRQPLGMSPGAMGGKAAPSAPTPDFLQFEQDRIISAPPKREAPKEEQISQQEYKKRVADATTRENEKARDRADDARDSVLRQGGSVQEAFDAAQTAFTGFTPSGEFVGATDPGTAAMNRFSKGGLASKSKKTKPKKRNTKKGLGGKMAT